MRQAVTSASRAVYSDTPLSEIAIRRSYGQSWRSGRLGDHQRGWCRNPVRRRARPYRTNGFFIERYLGFSPDGGDGSMEILVAVMLVVIVVVTGLRLATK